MRVFQPRLDEAGLRKIRFQESPPNVRKPAHPSGGHWTTCATRRGTVRIQITVDLFGHLIPGANLRDLSEVEMNGWDAGIRTPIRRSRVLLKAKVINQINNLAWQILEKSGKIRNAA